MFIPRQDITETEFAIQLFVERMVCPVNNESYSEKQMKNWILEKLNKAKEQKI